MTSESERSIGIGAIVGACIVGGVVAGALDIVYAFTAFGLRGAEPMRILQSIASGVLGKASFQGGAETAALGAALHFGMTIVMATVYVLASLVMPVLRAHAPIWGMAYGGAIYMTMNYVVVPLSLAASRVPPFEMYLAGLAVHILLVGLPIALIARLYLGPR